MVNWFGAKPNEVMSKSETMSPKMSDVVGWVDDATNSARAAVRAGAAWGRSTLGAGWWGGTVPVAAGGGAAVAGFAQPNAGNPNSVKLLARTWQ